MGCLRRGRNLFTAIVLVRVDAAQKFATEWVVGYRRRADETSRPSSYKIGGSKNNNSFSNSAIDIVFSRGMVPNPYLSEFIFSNCSGCL